MRVPSKFDAPESLRELLGEIVIVDTDAHYVHLGRLESAGHDFLKLSQVDVHEVTRSSLSKERYVHEAKSIGIRPNRKFTWINMARVVSLSRLDDLEEF